MDRNKNPLYLVAIIVMTLASVFYLYDFKGHKWNIKLGLDLRSGSRIVVQQVGRANPVAASNEKPWRCACTCCRRR